jgi:thiol:disulfide interchange protein DsbD
MRLNLKNIFPILIFILLGFFNFAYAQFGSEQNIVRLNIFSSQNKVIPGSQFKLAAKLDIKDGWHINSNKANDTTLITSKITIQSSPAFTLSSVTYPSPKQVKFSFSETPLSVWEGNVVAGLSVNVSKGLKAGKYPLILSLDYQACNNLTCLPPKEVKDTIYVEVTNQLSEISSINHDVFQNLEKTNLHVNNKRNTSNENDNTVTSTLEHSGLFLSLLFVFIGGLALNLTPCVYPLIPITIGYFGGQSEGSTSKLFLMGLFFVLGMAVTYSIIGVITALSGAVFGSLLQNMWVIIFIALIFVFLSLGMFGLYEISLPNSIVAKAGGAKGGYFGALFMGLTMGIVAAPCIGPFVLGLVTFVAAKADPYYGFMMFFFLALGLGFPYLILAIFSGKIKKLPRAGEWMESIKHIFGFILLGMSIYFLLPIIPKNISSFILPVYVIAAGIYLLVFDNYSNKVKAFRIFKIVFSVIIILISVYALIPSEKNHINWKPYESSAMQTNSAGSKGMIIDFYADWCIPCKELDAKTFSDENVIKAAKNFRTYKANMTKSLSPDVEALRDKYNIVGVPTVLIINSHGKEVNRITGYVDANEFLKILNNAIE